jgi:hypothetical protein
MPEAFRSRKILAVTQLLGTVPGLRKLFDVADVKLEFSDVCPGPPVLLQSIDCVVVLKYVRGYLPLLVLAYVINAAAMFFRFEEHLALRASSRTLFRAGSRIEINNAMIPMTTSSSTSVKPRVRRDG